MWKPIILILRIIFIFTWFLCILHTFGTNNSSSNSGKLIGFIDRKCHYFFLFHLLIYFHKLFSNRWTQVTKASFGPPPQISQFSSSMATQFKYFPKCGLAHIYYWRNIHILASRDLLFELNATQLETRKASRQRHMS